MQVIDFILWSYNYQSNLIYAIGHILQWDATSSLCQSSAYNVLVLRSYFFLLWDANVRNYPESLLVYKLAVAYPRDLYIVTKLFYRSFSYISSISFVYLRKVKVSDDSNIT